MSERGLKEKLEMVTNTMVIAAVLLFGFVIYRSYIHPTESTQQGEPAAGTALPALPGYSWNQHNETLLLVMRKGCHFCEDSMPFYRKLLQVERDGKTKAHIVSVLPDEEIAAIRLLQQANLNTPVVASYPLSQLNVSGTPTVILVNHDGRVERSWVGEQQAEGQKAILDAIRN